MTEGHSPKRNGDAERTGLRDAIRWRGVLRDLLVVTAWVAAASVGWRVLTWPMEAYYVVVFVGIVGYTLATHAWRAGDSRPE